MSFCTVINCMDGRVQLPVIKYLQKYFNTEFVDTITEPGPNKILSEGVEHVEVQSILKRLDISINKHNSIGIAIVGHHDCAGNPAPKVEQMIHINKSILLIKKNIGNIKNIEVIGLWVDENWEVQKIKA